jgi:threonine dehydrogenase-like Zn-dependent dehydrogenase
MQAAVLEKTKILTVREVPKPAADEDFLVVAVKSCGICGSDLRYFEGENPWALHTLGVSLPNPPNIILGHEFAGVVSEVVNPAFRQLLGRRVFIIAYSGCGRCVFCRSGLYNLCRDTRHLGHGAGWGKMAYYPGGMADYCQVWNTHAVELPDSVSFDEATLLDPISVAVHAIAQSRLTTGEDALVLGTGTVGFSIAQALRAFGVRKVIATDICEPPLRMARRCGVDYTVDASRQDVLRFVRETVGSVDAVFDTVGSRTSQAQGLGALRAGGRLVNLVANETEAAYRLADLAGEKQIIISANSRQEDYLLGLELVANGTIAARSMITHTFSLADVRQGFDILLTKKDQAVMKVVVHPEKTGQEAGR